MAMYLSDLGYIFVLLLNFQNDNTENVIMTYPKLNLL